METPDQVKKERSRKDYTEFSGRQYSGKRKFHLVVDPAGLAWQFHDNLKSPVQSVETD